MNADYRDNCTRALFDLTLARQAEFDAAARELREKREAWRTEENRLHDRVSEAWRLVEKVNRQLVELGCAAPDVIADEAMARIMRDVAAPRKSAEEGRN